MRLIIILLTILLCSFNNPTLIVNKTKKQVLTEAVKIGLNELNIKPTAVYIRQLEHSSDKNAYVIGSGKGGNYVIYIKNKSLRQSITLIAHELIHIAQEEKRELSYNKKTITHNHKTYNVDKLPRYKSRTWEIEAFKKERDLAKKIRKTLTLYEK